MAKGIKLTVRAQRKYAHKAYIPGQPYKSDAEPQELDATTPPQPVVMKTRKPVGDILDQVAFQNIHRHPERKKLKDVRVLLRRLSPLSDRGLAENKVGNNEKEIKPNAKEDELKQMNLRGRTILRKCQAKRGDELIIKSRERTVSETSTEDNRPLTYYAIKKKIPSFRRNKIKNSLRKTTPLPTRKSSRARAQAKPGKKNDEGKGQSSKRASEKSSTLNESKKSQKSALSILQVRVLPNNSKDRRLTRKTLSEIYQNTAMRKPIKLPFQVTIPDLPIKEFRYEPSDSSDNTTRKEPLPEKSKKKRSPLSKKRTRNACTVESPPKNKNHEKRSSSLLEDGICASSSTTSLVQKPLETQKSSVRNAPSGSKDLNLADYDGAILDSDIIQVATRNTNNRLEKDKDSDLRQPNTLSDFVFKIFNCDVTDNRGQDEANEIEGSLVRVQKWLANSQVQNDTQFKVPATPRWRTSVSRATSVASSSVVIGIDDREKSLRLRCVVWNYKTLSDVVLKKNLVRKFCGDCTRCLVMFKPEHIQNSTVSDEQNRTDVSDIYEFTTDRDDEILIRENPRDIFNNISTETDHVSKLKAIMTADGKKIFKAAIIIREKIEANEPLAPKEHTILAQVLGVLSQCNAGRIPKSQVAKVDSVRTTQLYNNDNTSTKTSSKRQRLESPSQNPNFTTAIRESKKIWPTTNEFKENLIKFARQIQQKYPGISICGIIPPLDFKPTCNKEGLEANFKMSNQYIHRMLNRWGAATRELTAIRSIQDPKIQRSPLFEGLEVDLVKLFHTVQSENGIEACQNNSEKWQIIAQKMKLCCRGKTNTKLENIYLKYLLSYNTLTPEEREKANTEVEKCWTEREIKSVLRAQKPLWRQERMRQGTPIDDDALSTHLEKVCAEAEECVTPGRNTNFVTFQKLAAQVQRTYFPGNLTPTTEEVEREFWNIVMSANTHVCVHAASVDATEHSCGFTSDRKTSYGSHHWNLKRLCWSSGNLLSYLGPSLGVSSTSIHYGMMFSTSCWHMDPTSVPWIEYLHTGPPKIWYTISADQEQMFRAAAEALCPFAVQNKDIWLPCDIIMIPPNLLRQYGITVERHVQHAGEFVIVYPHTYCACIDTGFTISEGVYFAPHDWIMDIEKIFLNLRNSCEPSLFSMEKLLIAMAGQEVTLFSLLQRVHTVLTSMLYNELAFRQGMADRNIELITPESFLEQNQRASRTSWQIQKSGECAYCRCHLHLSRVVGVTEGQTGVCAMHGIYLFDNAVSRQVQLTNVYCIMLFTNADIYSIINSLKQRMMSSIRDAI